MPLEEGERVVWEGRQSGVTGASQLWWIAAVFAGLGVLGLLSVPMLLLGDLGITEMLVVVGQQLVCAAPGFAMAAWWIVPRMRVSLALTDQRLLSRDALGRWTSVWLKQVQRADRYIAVYHTRHGIQEVATDRLQIQVGPKRVLWGPTMGSEFLLDLLEHAVWSGTRWIQLPMLPDLRGRPAPAETRDDVFLCAETKTDADVYGPLFIGKSRIVRITERLSGEQLGRLYTVLGDPSTDPVKALEATLSHPATGHFVSLDREKVRPLLDRQRLEIRGDDVQVIVDLSARDADRLRSFLAKSR